MNAQMGTQMGRERRRPNGGMDKRESRLEGERGGRVDHSQKTAWKGKLLYFLFGTLT